MISGATITQYSFIYTTTYALATLGYSQRVAMTANLVLGFVGTCAAVAVASWQTGSASRRSRRCPGWP